MALTSGVARER